MRLVMGFIELLIELMELVLYNPLKINKYIYQLL